MMTKLRDPDERRALRSVIQAAVALIVVGYVAWIIHLLRQEANPLMQIALGLVAVIGLGTFFYGAENVTRAVKFKAGLTGVEAQIGLDEVTPQDVATTAQDKVDEVTT